MRFKRYILPLLFCLLFAGCDDGDDIYLTCCDPSCWKQHEHTLCPDVTEPEVDDEDGDEATDEECDE